jgi:hypothetical protein
MNIHERRDAALSPHCRTEVAALEGGGVTQGQAGASKIGAPPHDLIIGRSS